MSSLPIRRDDFGAPDQRHLARAAREQARAELAIYRHALAAQFRAEASRLDSQAAADAVQAALEEEIDLLEYGMRRAAGSAAKAELVARRIEQLSAINTRNIGRRFG